jgi:hypothetical protein
MSYENYEELKVNHYNYLMDNYIEIIMNLVDFSNINNILPFKLKLGINYLKEYILNNRLTLLDNGLNYLLNNKEVIMNFDVNNLDQLDEDDDDNVSIKQCVNNLKKDNKLKNEDSELLDIIIDIKNNTKNLDNNKRGLIKKYFEIIISILEELKLILN